MDTAWLNTTRAAVRRELQSCIAFWLKNGMDPVHGGLFTCLDRTGKVYSTDKSVWMQGRFAWMLSTLCRVYGPKDEWLAAAKSCLDFLQAHCINHSAGNRLYFTVTQDGHPLRQRRYCFSEAFYCIANAAYYALTGEAACLERAQWAYERVYALNHGLIEDPAGLPPKVLTRPGRTLASPMIYLNLSNVMRLCDTANGAQYHARAGQAAEEILKFHHKPELRATLENVGPSGEFWGDASVGRVVNPGHSIECSWFLLEHARMAQDGRLAQKAVEMFDFALARGWDDEYGGLLYYTDVKGLPPEAYEHDMKLWWPHNELMIASLMIYEETRDAAYLETFKQAWAYSMDVFSDPAHGEWFGYCRRDGRPTQPPAKGSTFKGPFHLPRMLVMLDEMMGHLLGE